MAGGPSRRDFLRGCAASGVALMLPRARAAPAERRRPGPQAEAGVEELREARYWEPAGAGRARCLTCPNRCVCGEGEVSACRTRINRGGRLYTLAYGRPCVLVTDPLQKNPLYHVDPGAEAIGVATAGCNLRCTYCQNWDISQAGPWQTHNMRVSPEELVDKARSRGLRWITFSYTEPVAYYEYALDTARLAKRRGLCVALVTAGVISPEPLAELLPHVDAVSLTIKGYTEAFYREVCGAHPADVWSACRQIVAAGRWLEAAILVVPGMNDEEPGWRSVARSLARLDPDIPVHFLRFAPAFKLRHVPPTPVPTLERLREVVAHEGLRHVYLDLSGHGAANTYCPACKTLLIERVAFRVLHSRLRDGRCPRCRTSLPGVRLAPA